MYIFTNKKRSPHGLLNFSAEPKILNWPYICRKVIGGSFNFNKAYKSVRPLVLRFAYLNSCLLNSSRRLELSRQEFGKADSRQKLKKAGSLSLEKKIEKRKTKGLTQFLNNYHRSNQDTCLVHKPRVQTGEWVESGDLLADSSASMGGELAIGKNILVAYMPWEGYNFEDAILINERLVYDDVYTSIHIERYEIETKENSMGSEQITRQIPEISQKTISHLDSYGIASIGSWIEEGDILVGKVTPIKKKKQTPYQNLLFKLLEKKINTVRDSSLRAPRGMKANVIKVQILGVGFKPPTEKSSGKRKNKDRAKPYISQAKKDNKTLVNTQTKKQKDVSAAGGSKELRLINNKVVQLKSKLNKPLATAPLKSNSLVFFNNSSHKLELLKKSSKSTRPINKNQLLKPDFSYPFISFAYEQTCNFNNPTGAWPSPFNFNQNPPYSCRRQIAKPLQGLGLRLGQAKRIIAKSSVVLPILLFKASGLNYLDKITCRRKSFFFNSKPLKGLEKNLVYFYCQDPSGSWPEADTSQGGNPPIQALLGAFFLLKSINKKPNLLLLKTTLSPATLGKLPNFFLLKSRKNLNCQDPSGSWPEADNKPSPYRGLAYNKAKSRVYPTQVAKPLTKYSDKKETKLLNSSLIKQEPKNPWHLNKQVTVVKTKKKIPTLVHIYLAEKRKIQVGDKMAGRHGNKGIISNILPRQDMPYLPDGTALDIVLNPLGVPSRMNVGQIYECLLGLAGKYLGEHYKIYPFDEIFGAEASRSFVFAKLFEARKKIGLEWLFDPDSPGKIRLIDGRNGECFDQPVTVGIAYMLKLVHMVDDKIHMRSTGPYSLVTQQPLRGRAKQGGQRLGEMEVWAIEGYGAAFVLLEMLTIKSDDMTGRLTLWSNLILNKEITVGTPESFKVLVCELQALCLDIGLYHVIDKAPNSEKLTKLKEVSHLMLLP